MASMALLARRSSAFLRAPALYAGKTNARFLLSQNSSIAMRAVATSAASDSSIDVGNLHNETLERLETSGDLCKMAVCGDVEGLKKAIAAGMDINAEDYDFRTPLHLAAASGNIETVELLLASGAVSKPDRFGGLPIHDATRSNYTDIAQLLKGHPVQLSSVFDPDTDTNIDMMQTVFNMVVREGVFSFALVSSEIKHFFNELKMDPEYFRIFTEAQIAKHVHSLIAAKKVALIGRHPTNIKVDIEDQQSLFFMFTSENAKAVEKVVERYLADTPEGYHLAFVKSANAVLPEHPDSRLMMYYVERCRYENPKQPGNPDVYATSTPDFLRRHRGLESLKRYEEIVEQAVQNPHPVFAAAPAIQPDDTTLGYNIKVAVDLGGAVEGTSNQETFLRKVNKTLGRLGVGMQSSSINAFSNGVSVFSAYVRDCDEAMLTEMESFLSLSLIMPETILLEHFFENLLSPRMFMYFHAASRFAYYFQYKNDENFESLYESLEHDPIKQAKLARFGPNLGTEVHQLNRFYSCVSRNMDMTRPLYIDFARKFTGDVPGYDYGDLEKLIAENVEDKEERAILNTFRVFNKSVTSTNLWKTQKSAISYRLDPKAFLTRHKIPELPFAVYMVMGLNFSGFHVRFRDISRGGVRVILSGPPTYNKNRASQFMETYNLAYTQQIKNKDIPEGGSKGTILMKQGKNNHAHLAFIQYADAILDIMLNEEGVKDVSNHHELIFLGPDENSAPFMDPGCEHAHKRGYQFWRSFTTGKSLGLGGIPHDTYGMTTRSVRAYIKGLQEYYNLDETECTKAMTGGPDGDLGSNEILMSKEKIVTLIDGSGVLHDPEGLDRGQLESLAKKRRTCDHFDTKALSEQGFLVRVGQKQVELPNGDIVADGTTFRDEFHLWEGMTADFFVPCGGRPGSVGLNNVHRMFDKHGRPRFKYVVEGANLFITEGARDILQDRGVILFKDSSSNKGGVTCSSLEVLASLALTDQQYAMHMTEDTDGTVPPFYETYVQEICDKVEKKASDEFRYVHETALKTNDHRTHVSDNLSASMIDLSDMITASPIFDDDEGIRNTVLAEAIPQSLQDLVGLDVVLGRVPKAYQKAIFSMHLASQYVYTHGSEPNPYQFYEFMKTRYE